MDLSIDAETHIPALPERRVEVWSRLNLLFPYLILHDPNAANGKHDKQPQDTRASIRKAIRARIELAEAGNYAALIAAAIEAERAAAIREASAPIHERT